MLREPGRHIAPNSGRAEAEMKASRGPRHNVIGNSSASPWASTARDIVKYDQTQLRKAGFSIDRFISLYRHHHLSQAGIGDGGAILYCQTLPIVIKRFKSWWYSWEAFKE
jgi:hypothetical protein